jgi:GrpB-like predicted nucleotidyltransferase (UPF0157 family)
MIDEPVSLAPYDPEWPLRAHAEIERLSGALGPAVLAYEHFGSTSVPGCAAKPILDLLVGVPSWPPTDALRRQLTSLGYEDLGEAGVPERLYFRKRSGLACNLAVTEYGKNLWRDNLAIRDLLRRDAALRQRYEEVKQAALREGHLLAYSAHKSAFMAELLARAREGIEEPDGSKAAP